MKNERNILGDVEFPATLPNIEVGRPKERATVLEGRVAEIIASIKNAPTEEKALDILPSLTLEEVAALATERTPTIPANPIDDLKRAQRTLENVVKHLEK